MPDDSSIDISAKNIFSVAPGINPSLLAQDNEQVRRISDLAAAFAGNDQLVWYGSSRSNAAALLVFILGLCDRVRRFQTCGSA